MDGEPILVCLRCRGARTIPGPKPCPMCSATGKVIDAAHVFAPLRKCGGYPMPAPDGVTVSQVASMRTGEVDYEIHFVRRGGGHVTAIRVSEAELRGLVAESEQWIGRSQ